MAPILDLSHAHVVDGSQWKPTQKGRCSLISLKICIPASSSGVLRCIIAALETDVTQICRPGPEDKAAKAFIREGNMQHGLAKEIPPKKFPKARMLCKALA